MSQGLVHFLSQIPLINSPVLPNLKQNNCASGPVGDTISIAMR